MKFHILHKDPIKQKGDCLVAGIFEKGEMTLTAKNIDKLSRGQLSRQINMSEMTGKIGQTLMLFDLDNIPFKRILLVGCGKEHTLNVRHFRQILNASIKAMNAAKASNAVITLTEVTVEKHTAAWKIKQAAEVCHNALYQFNEFKSEKCPAASLKDVTFFTTDSNLKHCEKALDQGVAISSGVEYTKNLANLPSNICTPTYLANEAKQLAKKFKSIKTTVIDESGMKKLGMGALLAVAKGSAQPPKLICIEYKGTAKKQAPIALVGKGITFDTGGLSLKPADAMVGMKYDMCGAATVLGTLKAAAELKLPIHIVGIIAAAENMPSGNAARPEDIVTTLSGQTVEIMNTDAEGRLVLCDALTYCERYKPETVIDIATLTGAVVIALGHHATGLLANQDKLAQELIQAGTESHDRVWQLPLWDEYQEQLKSPFADMSNVGGRSAGTITAACFLSRFAKKYHWAHLDVAGTAAMMMGNERYATGRPVPLLTQFLINRCQK